MWGDRTPFGNNPPDKVHVTLQPDQLRSGRILIVGDVHGCLLELDDLLEACHYDRKTDNLILAGDIINKGPQSIQVIQRARELKAHVIRGNHEDACLALRRRFKLVSTLSSSYKWLKSLSDQDTEYLEQLPFTISIPSHNVIVVHAGFIPDGTAMQEQSLKTMLFLEDVVQEPKTNKFKVYYKVKEEHQSWAAYWQGPDHVIFGHASGRTLQKHPYATGIDTGCVGGGHLTACVLPPASDLSKSPLFQAHCQQHPHRAPTLAQLGAELVQVPCRHKLEHATSNTMDDFTRAGSDNFSERERNLQTDSRGQATSFRKWTSQVKSMPVALERRTQSQQTPAEV